MTPRNPWRMAVPGILKGNADPSALHLHQGTTGTVTFEWVRPGELVAFEIPRTGCDFDLIVDERMYTDRPVPANVLDRLLPIDVFPGLVVELRLRPTGEPFTARPFAIVEYDVDRHTA